jgi:hypothetical protein
MPASEKMSVLLAGGSVFKATVTNKAVNLGIHQTGESKWDMLWALRGVVALSEVMYVFAEFSQVFLPIDTQ